MACSLQLIDRRLRRRTEAGRLQTEALLEGRGCRAEGNSVGDRAFAGLLHDGVVRRARHAHIHTIPTRPGSRYNFLAGETESHPDWLGSRQGCFGRTVNQITADRRAEAAD